MVWLDITVHHPARVTVVNLAKMVETRSPLREDLYNLTIFYIEYVANISLAISSQHTSFNESMLSLYFYHTSVWFEQQSVAWGDGNYKFRRG